LFCEIEVERGDEVARVLSVALGFGESGKDHDRIGLALGERAGSVAAR
jgi:hypothetical protein